MKLREIYQSEKTIISFEIFPPDDEEKFKKLQDEITILNKYTPQFFSLTCGATGKKSRAYRTVLEKLKQTIDTDIMPHITCINRSKEEIDSHISFLKSLKTENVLALRGDYPEDSEDFYNYFCYANDLVEYIKTNTDFSIAVAGYPEGHLESKTIEDDIENLKKKISSGADAIFTQMFFENDKFFNYLERLEKAKIQVPVIAGIMPIISFKHLEKIMPLARVTLPAEFKNKIINHFQDKDYVKKLGIEFASKQCAELIENKVKGLHFFTLNKAFSTSKILDNIL